MSFRQYLARLRQLIQPGRQRSRPLGSARSRLLLEALEDRTLPAVALPQLEPHSNIVWTNRGGPGGSGEDSDRFEYHFGVAAEQARAIVDAAIVAWEQVIINFNWSDADITQFDLEVRAEDIGNNDDDSARAHTSGGRDDSDDVPYAATITLDADAAGDNWYLDPTPRDNSEFLTTIGNIDTAGSLKLFAENDMFRTVLHEMGHAFGISASADGFEEEDLRIGEFLQLTFANDYLDVGEDGEYDGGKLMLFDAGGEHLIFTTAGGLHLWEGVLVDADFGFDSLYHGDSDDLMNSGRNSRNYQRRMISDLDARILAAAYGYDVRLPSTVANLSYLADLNVDTGVLTINGGLEALDHDSILIRRQGNAVSVNVVGANILFPQASVTAIRVQTATVKDGEDILTIDFSGGNPIPVGGLTFDGGQYADRLVLTGLGPSLPCIVTATAIQVGGHAFDYTLLGVEELLLIPTGGPAEIYVEGTPAFLPKLTVSCPSQGSHVHLHGRASVTELVVNGGGGDDHVYVAYAAGNLYSLDGTAPITLLGGGGTDGLVFDDAATNFGSDYTLDTVAPGVGSVQTSFVNFT